MLRRRTILMSLLALLAASGAALANPAAEPRDAAARQHFDALAERLYDAKAEYEKHFAAAVNEARLADDGRARPDTKAAVLSARDRHDLILEQLMLMSARYGWPIPDRPEPADAIDENASDPSQPAKDAVRDEFEAVDVLLRRHFAQDAARLAATIALPETPIRPLRKAE